MTKKPAASEPMKPQRIQWVEVDGESWSRGHGVEFLHRAFPHTVLAFLVGFEWLHHPGGPVTVEVLKRRPETGAAGDWPAILDEVRDAVRLFLTRGHCDLNRFRHEQVTVWING